MAAPAYTTDLTTVAIGSITVDAGTWDESSDAAWDGGGSMVDDSNLYYNGIRCVSAQYTKSELGTIMYEHTSSVTVPTDGAVLIHHLWAAPPALATLALGGVRILVGNGFGVFFAWDISGSDHAPAPKGGWANYAINPGIGSPDDTVGSPATPYDTFGIAVDATAQARGNPNAVNAIRYGRCESRFTDGDSTNGYATFEGFGDTDSSSSNKWSLIDPVEGGYKFQGLMSLGLTGTSVDFRDSNVDIVIANTIKVTSGFNKIEVHNASSNIEWTAVKFKALGTVSKGSFEMIDNATVAKTNCEFTDMSTFIYLSNATMTNTTYRRTDQVTTGGASFDGCTFDSLTPASGVVTSSPANAALITDSAFTSDGNGNGLEIGGTATNITLTGLDFDGYSTTVDADKAIYVNIATGSMTINISGGSGVTASSHIRTAGCTVTVSADVSVKFDKMKDDTEVRVYATGTNTEIDGIEDVTDGTTNNRSFTWASPASTVVDYVIHHWSGSAPFYKTIRVNGYTVPSTNTTIDINQLVNRNAT